MYMDYFEEYVHDATAEMYQYFIENGIPIEDDDDEEGGKPGVYKVNYYLRDHIQVPYVSAKLAKSKIQDAIIDFTGAYLDKHSTHLSTSGPVHFFTFGDEETSFLYNTFGITGDEIIKIFREMIQETYYGKLSKFIEGWVVNAPHKILLTAILIEAIQKGYEDIVTCCEYLWAFCEYPLVYRTFWQTGVKEDVMNYTIEHLGSKYKVKKVNNLQGLLKYDAHSSVSAVEDRLKNGVDNAYADFMQRMRNQIKNTFKNIAIAYYANDEANATQHNNVSQFDDGTLADQEGHATNVAQTVDATVNKFSGGGINNAIARIAADGSQVDKDNLVGYIGQINSTKNNKLYKLVEDIITVYFNKNPISTSVGDADFVNFGLSLFKSIATSKDPMYHEIRQILDYWMYEIINIKQFYQREGTVTAYTRAIFNYIIMMINYYN